MYYTFSQLKRISEAQNFGLVRDTVKKAAGFVTKKAAPLIVAGSLMAGAHAAGTDAAPSKWDQLKASVASGANSAKEWVMNDAVPVVKKASMVVADKAVDAAQKVGEGIERGVDAVKEKIDDKALDVMDKKDSELTELAKAKAHHQKFMKMTPQQQYDYFVKHGDPTLSKEQREASAKQQVSRWEQNNANAKSSIETINAEAKKDISAYNKAKTIHEKMSK